MIIISLGGSAIVPDKIDTNFLNQFKELILKHNDKKFILIIGGGKICRTYQEAAKELGNEDKEDLDWVGIAATKLNAELVRAVFKDKAYEKVAENPTQKYETDKIIVACGWKPGCSTDNDAVLFAKTYGAKKLINITNIDYVYDKDPREFPDAKKIENLTWDELKQVVGGEWIPGLNAPFDPIAAKTAESLQLQVIVTAKDLDNLDNILNEKEFKGTTIKP